MNPQMNGFACPHCRQPLLLMGRVLRCAKGHSYDLAKEGYANLLEVQQKHSKMPGDSQEMVRARHRFLSHGNYDIFAAQIGKLTVKYSQTLPRVLDTGCGEGYYTRDVFRQLENAGFMPEIIGFDIARPAVRLAAKALPQGSFAVASSYAIPVVDGWANLVLNIFSPWAGEEFLRVMQPGAHLIYAVPTAQHLWGLKQVLYQKPYPNEEKEVLYDGFTLVEECRVEGSLRLDNAQLQDLFAMTPYYWKTPKEGCQRLAALPGLETPIGFRLLVYRKNS